MLPFHPNCRVDPSIIPEVHAVPDTSRQLTIEDLLGVASVGDPHLSPSGDVVAFVVADKYEREPRSGAARTLRSRPTITRPTANGRLLGSGRCRRRAATRAC